MEQTNQFTEATWRIAIKIWWWIMWRALLCAIAGGFLLGFIIGLIGGAIGLDVSNIKIFAMALGFLMGVVIHVFFIKESIGNRFNGHSLVLVKKDEPEND